LLSGSSPNRTAPVVGIADARARAPFALAAPAAPRAMKFGQTLKYNAVPEWQSHYMAYDHCKHMVETIRVLQMRLFYALHPSEVPEGHAHACDDESTDDEDEDDNRRGFAGNGSRTAGGGGGGDGGGGGGDARNIREGSRELQRRPVRIARSASQRVLHELASDQFSMEAPGLTPTRSQPPPRAPPSPHSSVTQGDGLTIRQLRARLNSAEMLFFERLASEAARVDKFYSSMLIHLPQYSLAFRQRIGQLLDHSIPALASHAGALDVEHGGERTAVELADDTTPLLDVSPGHDSSPRRLRFLASGLASPVLRSFQSPGVHDQSARKAELDTLRGRLCAHYVDIVGMVNFSELNSMAFDKILKKHDKVTRKNTRAAYMENLRKTRKFLDASVVDALRKDTETLFAEAYTNKNREVAKDELHEGVRDHIIWSRNTVWRDMLRDARKINSISASKGSKVFVKKPVLLLAAVSFCVIMMFPGIVHRLPVVGSDQRQYSKETLDAAHRCLALLVAVVILWSQDGLPLYVTGFLVLPSTVVLRLLLDKSGVPLPPPHAAQMVFSAMSSSTILLIICVYTLHAALSKYNIDKKLASGVLSRIKGAQWLLLAVMLLAVVLSMLVSNVASPVLLNSIVLPVLLDMPKTSRPFVQCMLLGIAVASNIGGMPSPISSPQNTVGLGLLYGKNEVSFTKWLLVALPLSLVMIALTFLLLVVWFKPHRYRLPTIPMHNETFAWPHYVVVGTIIVTVILWVWRRATNALGSAGMVAVLPLIIFYGTGLLGKEDFNNLPWDVVYLVAGGIVLGDAVKSSKLLGMIASRLHYSLGNAPVWVAFAAFSTFMAIVANMISHTVSAIIVLPVIAEVGLAMGHARLLVMGGVLACSSAMSLPISSFPNMAALSVTSELGEPFLKSADILKVGVPMTALCTGVVLTLGYAWMTCLGF
jgi:phosphate transporter